jgi:hypothetical protein
MAFLNRFEMAHKPHTVLPIIQDLLQMWNSRILVVGELKGNLPVLAMSATALYISSIGLRREACACRLTSFFAPWLTINANAASASSCRAWVLTAFWA